MKPNLRNYLQLSSIHGLSYFSKQISFRERIFWIIALISSIICTTALIAQLVIKIYLFPVVVYVSDHPVSVNEINFPAVTLCPLSFLRQRTVYEIDLIKNFKYFRYEKHTMDHYIYEDEEFREEVQDEIKLFNTTFNITLHNVKNFNYLEFLKQLETGHLNPKNLGIKFMKRLQLFDILTNQGIFSKLNLSIPADDLLDVMNEFPRTDFPAVTFRSRVEYQSFISEIITPFGFCHTFNAAFSRDMLNLNSTSDDFHYQVLLPLHKYRQVLVEEILPRKTETWYPSGVSMTAILFQEFLRQTISNKFFGAYLMVHDPYELPTTSSKIFKVPFNKITTILIEPKMNSIDDSIAGYELENRNCYLEDEKRLKFFKVYTPNNCKMECLSAFVLDRCGCVIFWMIRNSTTRICSASENTCYEDAERDFSNIRSDCKCLPLCNNIEYNLRLSEDGFGEAPEKYALQLNLDVHVKFAANTFNDFIRKQQFNELDFISFVGGLLGLFTGFSALSFVELLYWFTVRLFTQKCNKMTAQVHPLGINQNEPKQGSLDTFLKESSIHGLKFVKSLTKLDRILWIIFILTSMTICIHLVGETREKIPDGQITAYDDVLKIDEKIPFPAFIFVPHKSTPVEDVKYVYDKFPTMAEKIKQFSINYHHWYCNHFDTQYLIRSKNYSDEVDQFTFVREQSAASWFQQEFSSLNGRYKPRFTEVQTTRGMGFTFNMIDDEEMFNVDEIDPNFRYTRNVTMNNSNLAKLPDSLAYPLTFSRNDKTVLTLKISAPKINNEICILPSFLIHNSDQDPIFNVRTDFTHFHYGMRLDIEVTPEILKTDYSLKALSPQTRECYFEDEKQLKYFKKYTEKNCEIECLSNATLGKCTCDQLDKKGRGREICKNDMHSEYQDCQRIVFWQLSRNNDFSPKRNCSCLPLCNSITYKVSSYAETSTGNETILNVRMNMDDMILYRRYQQFTTSDVISYVGGLLGLFAGISMLSIVEFIYFFSIRSIVDFSKRLSKSLNL